MRRRICRKLSGYKNQNRISGINAVSHVRELYKVSIGSSFITYPA